MKVNCLHKILLNFDELFLRYEWEIHIRTLMYENHFLFFLKMRFYSNVLQDVSLLSETIVNNHFFALFSL